MVSCFVSTELCVVCFVSCCAVAAATPRGHCSVPILGRIKRRYFQRPEHVGARRGGGRIGGGGRGRC